MWKAICLVVVVWVLICYGLCVNSGDITRGEERKELEEWIRENKK